MVYYHYSNILRKCICIVEIINSFILGYINEAGTLNLERFEKFMERLSRLDIEQFNEYLTDLKYLENKMGRKFNQYESPMCQNVEDGKNSSPKQINKDTQATEEMVFIEMFSNGFYIN